LYAHIKSDEIDYTGAVQDQQLNYIDLLKPIYITLLSLIDLLTY